MSYLLQFLGFRKGRYEESYLLGYNTVKFIKCQLTFRRNTSHPYSVLMNKSSKEVA
jgi:hypothetical protein